MGIDPVTYFLQGAADCIVDELANGYIVFFLWTAVNGNKFMRMELPMKI